MAIVAISGAPIPKNPPPSCKNIRSDTDLERGHFLTVFGLILTKVRPWKLLRDNGDVTVKAYDDDRMRSTCSMGNRRSIMVLVFFGGLMGCVR